MGRCHPPKPGARRPGEAGRLYHFTAATGDVNAIAKQNASGEALAVVSTLA
ncbi:hypothetical protein OEIGOIKO_05573 [Streptomyces chrestomyceticus JCM 4735]|uniref:Uncharacterized protein n=1 Tax=Streptomyces chrestomyceticus JCM 4735 TaxID=1306181 RepID=A0A7U9KYJ1_9ACTN|nr:hypothetical protein OEIGOIKO_05573 [Streptomyces chrestomyceticus JCM 4735]